MATSDLCHAYFAKEKNAQGPYGMTRALNTKLKMENSLKMKVLEEERNVLEAEVDRSWD